MLGSRRLLSCRRWWRPRACWGAWEWQGDGEQSNSGLAHSCISGMSRNVSDICCLELTSNHVPRYMDHLLGFLLASSAKSHASAILKCCLQFTSGGRNEGMNELKLAAG